MAKFVAERRRARLNDERHELEYPFNRKEQSGGFCFSGQFEFPSGGGEFERARGESSLEV
jgi:hypothetical protein